MTTLPSDTHVAVSTPTFGTETNRAAQFLVDAAWKLRSGYTVGGSTVSAGIARLLDDVAAQLDPTARTTYAGHAPHPDEPTREVHITELTYEERQALPAVYHRPVFDDLGTPASWRCAVCWDAETAVTHAWPCGPATAGGATLARHLGLERTR